MQITIQIILLFYFKDDKNIPLVQQWWCQTEKTNEPKCGQTNTTKTTKCKQIVNTITLSVKANKNGREINNSKLQMKRTSNELQNKNGTVQNETLNVYEREGVQWSWMRKQWRSKSSKEDAETVQRNAHTVEREEKWKWKRVAGLKQEAPCRFWASNRRGSWPEIPKLSFRCNTMSVRSLELTLCKP